MSTTSTTTPAITSAAASVAATSTSMAVTPLAAATDEARFGGKAAALARALGAGLPVPDGWALDDALVEAIAAGDRAAEAALDAIIRTAAASASRTPGALFAVRSSAIGEDGAARSFAGQHLTRLGVAPSELADAVRAVRDSVHAPSALAYRARLGIEGTPRTGVVVQPLIAADRAAVVFTRDPVGGGDVTVIEASLGLGETVVGGAVVPIASSLRATAGRLRAPRATRTSRSSCGTAVWSRSPSTTARGPRSASTIGSWPRSTR